MWENNKIIIFKEKQLYNDNIINYNHTYCCHDNVQKEKDLELAARIGQKLLQENEKLRGKLQHLELLHSQAVDEVLLHEYFVVAMI